MRRPGSRFAFRAGTERHPRNLSGDMRPALVRLTRRRRGEQNEKGSGGETHAGDAKPGKPGETRGTPARRGAPYAGTGRLTSGIGMGTMTKHDIS